MPDTLNVGEVALDLAGKTVTLRPTLRAAQAINRHFGSLADALRQIGSLNLEAYVAVVRHGSGASDAEQRELADRVWRAGLTTLGGPLAEYLALLLRGGRPEAPDPEPEGEQGNA